ncbi:MAG: antibiotic biosynthesis monooxygenase [Gammaproteobacteria bacterium]|nr:antibiotic biosynthesis monooxygenase [Gammaproteobacteria bacterium]
MAESKHEGIAPAGRPPAEPVTVIVARRFLPERAAENEAFLRGITAAAQKFPGHLGVTVFRPASADDPEYRLVFRFDSMDHFRAWEQSPERAKWLAIGEQLSPHAAEIEVLTGLETWFTLPGARGVAPPPKYKMMLLVMLAIYPLSLLLNLLLGQFLAALAAPLRVLVFTVLLVPCMTYVVMPALTRLLGTWLYPGCRVRTAAHVEPRTE